MVNLTDKFIEMMAGQSVKSSTTPSQNSSAIESQANANALNPSIAQPSTFSGSKVIVTRLMVEITKYPNGNEYCKAWIINSGEKKNVAKKQKPKTEAKAQKTEVEEL